jgi:hypothetical protein
VFSQKNKQKPTKNGKFQAIVIKEAPKTDCMDMIFMTIAEEPAFGYCLSLESFRPK